MWNEGIDCRGFGGDTMHMARLQDTSRSLTGGGTGYSLEALSESLLVRRKQPMKEIFGVKRQRKDGTEGLIADLPPVEVMQRDPQHRVQWIKYSTYDAEGTWLLREKLQELLQRMSWREMNLYDYYEMHMRPFGEVLTDMERRGIRVDARDLFGGSRSSGTKGPPSDTLDISSDTRAKQIGPDGLAINTASSLRLVHLSLWGCQKIPKRKFNTGI
jgi:DNA polymerase-1